jgi:dolichol-phosphate mannosyltransferase
LDAARRTCVVVPTYNERGNIEPLVASILSALPTVDVLFVDDSSPDGTADEVRRVTAGRANLHLLVREAKKGIGGAYLEGFRHAMDELGATALVEMDADLQHPPDKLPELLSTLASGYDVVVASRKIPGGGTTGWPLWRRTVSSGANSLARIGLGLKVKDCTSGFRAITKESATLLLGAHLPDSGYSFQVASLFVLKKAGKRMTEVPFTFRTRQVGKSKMGMSEIGRFFFSVLKIRLTGV